MSIHRKLLLVLCAGGLVVTLGSARAFAAAASYLASPSSFTLTSNGAVSFATLGMSARCNVTLTGSFTSGSIGARSGEAAGSITRASTSSCSGPQGGAFSFLSATWPVTFRSFSGRQPEGMTGFLVSMGSVGVTGINMERACLFRGEVGLNIALTGTNPYSAGTVSTLANSLSLVSGRCTGTASLSGSFTFSTTQWIGEFPPALPLQPSANMISRERTLTGLGIEFQNTEVNETFTGALGFDRLGWSMSDTSGCAFRRLRANQKCPITLRGEAFAPATQLIVLESPGGARIGLLTLIVP